MNARMEGNTVRLEAIWQPTIYESCREPDRENAHPTRASRGNNERRDRRLNGECG